MIRSWKMSGTQTSERIPSFRAIGFLKKAAFSVSSI